MLIIIRRKVIGLGVIGVLYIAAMILSFCLTVDYRETIQQIGEMIILIDPGHGGVDGGTRDAWGHLEKDINLMLGKEIQRQLTASGMQVVMTREQDIALAPFTGRPGRHSRDLQERIRRARQHQCLFLVSIHCDWSKDPAETGAKVFYHAGVPESKQLALTIQKQLNRNQPRQRKAAPGKYFVIRQPGVTGVIVEVGFLSNPQEAKSLQEKAFQRQLALAVAQGILAHSQSYFAR